MSAACTCDPELDYGPNNADCPRHGEEIRQWARWEEGLARCPYCIGRPWEEFIAICDCWQAERETNAREPVAEHPEEQA